MFDTPLKNNDFFLTFHIWQCIFVRLKNHFLKYKIMKKISLNSIVVLLFVALLSSCKENHSVPAFPEELTNYFPYKEGESFSFVSEDNDTLTFVSKGVALSSDNSHTQHAFSFVSCTGDDFAWMNMITDATTVPYWDDKKIVIEFEMTASQTSPKSDGVLSIGFSIENASKYNGYTHIAYSRQFECSPFDGSVNLQLGDEIILYENGHQEWSDSRAKVVWNKGIESFDFDGKKWTAGKTEN